MLEVDFHSHSLFSSCGLHSIIELLTEARRRGLKALAVTDHGPAVEHRFSSTFFERLGQPVEGIRFLKGMECNPIGPDGVIDLPDGYLKFMDVVLLGLHYTVPPGAGEKGNTDLLLRILARNPCIDIVTHPGFDGYAVDLEVVAEACRKNGTALELNNSKLLYAKQTPEEMEKLIKACMKTGCRVVISSDAHALQEIGEDGFIRPLLKRAGFPERLLVNRDGTTALAFVEERRPLKKG